MTREGYFLRIHFYPTTSIIKFQEHTIVNQQIINRETFGFQRRAFGLHATLGFDASYRFARRRVEATAEVLLHKDV